MPTTQQGNDEQLLRRKGRCEKFIAAYRGEREEFLGTDTPSQTRNELFNQEPCSLLISTNGQDSQFLTSAEESTRYRYRPFSQDPSIEIYIGRMFHNASTNHEAFERLATLEINSDQLEGPVTRAFVPDVTPPSFRSTLLGPIGPIAKEDSEIDSVVQPLKNPGIENGVDCMVFKIAKGQVWIRRSQDHQTSNPSLIKSLQRIVADIEYVTVVRRAERATAKLGDELWDYLMHRYLQDGVYWAYGRSNPRPAKSATLQDRAVEKYVSLRQIVAQGVLQPPKVSWFQWAEMEWKKIVDRARTLEGERIAWEKEKALKDADEWLERNFG